MSTAETPSLKTYTVIALYTPDDGFVVAGVVEGDHMMADAPYYEPRDGDYQRFAASVEATSAYEAERLVAEEIRFDSGR
jgi:hypothetical protein